MEGTRPLLVEVQALASQTAYPNPRRTGNGVDFNRLQLLIAVLSRRIERGWRNRIFFVERHRRDATIDEPAADLCHRHRHRVERVGQSPYPADLRSSVVGLSDELRAVAHLPARLREASKLGFRPV